MQPFNGTAAEWNECIVGLPNPHLLQTWEWSRVKARYGWEPLPFVWSSRSNTSDKSDMSDLSDVCAAAMVLKRRIPIARVCGPPEHPLPPQGTAPGLVR